jgi:MFS family permease
MSAMASFPRDYSTLKPSRVRLGVLGFACSLSLLTYLDRICISRVQDDIQNDLGFSPVGMGFVFSAFALGYALFEIPGGWMGDAWGPRRVITRIVLCWSLFTAMTGLVDQLLRLTIGESVTPGTLLVSLVLIRFLFGCGEAGAYPNLTRVTSTWFPFRERALTQGAIWFSARMGGAFSYLIIGRLTVWLGWRQAFCVLGVVGMVWCIVFAWWFRDKPEEKAGCNAAERELIREGAPPDLALRVHTFPPLRKLVCSASIWGLCVASFCVSFGWYFYPTWQPRYLKEVHGISMERSELIAGLPFVCGAVGALAGGRWSDVLVRRTGSRRWGRSLVGVIGFTGAGICVLATGFVQSAWQAVALLCLAFLINDLAIPSIWAASADIGGRFAGTVSGVMNTTGAIGAFLSPILMPYILKVLPSSFTPADSWRLIFAGLGGAWLVGAVAWLFIDASKPLLDPVASSSASPPPAPFSYKREQPDGITTGEPSPTGVRTDSNAADGNERGV